MSDYKQTSFSGGFNLLLEDTRLPVTVKYKESDSPYDITFDQYRIASNVRARFDICTPIQQSVVELGAPSGLKQAIVSFGRYVIVFIAGSAYYKQVGTTNWTKIVGFSMSTTAPRYWTVAVPLNTTNYGRQAVTTNSVVSANNGITQTPILSASAQFGNIPGLLVQDGGTQPQFLYIDTNNIVQCRTTQTYQQWTAIYNNNGVLTNDLREYVPVGTFMEFYNGILFVVSPDYASLYRSVSGRPLDFMVNVTTAGQAGGDATTTSYSVGVGGITAIRAMQGDALFVAAGGGTFLVKLNQTPNSPTIFGEYTFNRQILFTSSCISERGIIDITGPISSNSSATSTSGDTVFIAAEGLRSFNSVEQQQNEGRNSVFSSTVQSLFTGITQTLTACSAVTFDNYALFSVNTTMGYAIVVYDTINSCYTSVDFSSLSGAAAKQFAAITVGTLALFAITSDDKVVQLYASTQAESAIVRLGSVSSQDPKKELQVIDVRAIFTNITKDISITCSLFVNNRYDSSVTEKIKYVPPVTAYVGSPIGTDVGTQTNSLRFPFPNSAQGWKAFPVLTWTDGASLTAVSVSTKDITPVQPLRTQTVIQQT
jgi:hypothetical protein